MLPGLLYFAIPIVPEILLEFVGFTLLPQYDMPYIAWERVIDGEPLVY